MSVSFYLLVCMVALRLVPVVAPSFSSLCFIRIILTIVMVMVDCTPFINDYVKAESRGKACSLNALVIVSSQIFSSQVLIPYSKSVPTNEAFTNVCLAIAVISICALLMIREKTLKPSDTDRETQEFIPLGTQISDHVSTLQDALVNKIFASAKWIHILVATSISYLLIPFYSTYLMLWLNSFVAKGVL